MRFTFGCNASYVRRIILSFGLDRFDWSRDGACRIAQRKTDSGLTVIDSQ
jgi:hypothetical protein